MNYNKNIIIAIDIGTQSVKIVAYNQEGLPIVEIAKPSKAILSEWGGVKFDPNQYLQITVEILKELKHHTLIQENKIAVLSFSGVGGGIVCVDNQLKPISSFVNPLDGRDKKIKKELLSNYGTDICEIAGSVSLQSASKIKWFQINQPEIDKKTSKYLIITHYIQSILSGHSIENVFEGWTTIASQGLGDTKNYKWSEKLCELLDISIEKLPKIVSPFEKVGTLSEKWSKIIGLPSGIPIVAGAFDKISSLIASGCIDDHVIFEETASWPSIIYPAERFSPDTESLTIQLLPTSIKNIWCGLAAIKGGGITHEWFTKNFTNSFSSNLFSELDKLSVNVPPGSDNLYLIPHLEGQECPIDPSMRGLWVGFKWKHKKEHFYRSILESIVFEYKRFIEKLNRSFFLEASTPVRSCGGGSKSRVWNQIKADILNRKIQILERNDLSTLGSAIVGGVGVGLFSDINKTVKKFIKIKEEITPNEENVEKYESISRNYEKIIILQKIFFIL